jgi:predicted ArsR family transcriptional regulator
MNLDNDAAADRILLQLKRRGPQRLNDLATVLGVTAEAIRQQVQRLTEDGLVDHETETGARGRPARLWRLTPSGHARFPDTHAEVTVQLIEAMRDTLGEAALDRVIAHREAAMRRQYEAALDGLSLGERVAKLATLRTAEGYLAEWRATESGWLLLENHCPICAAATACQGFCRSELDIFRTVIGPDATVERTEHQLAGARRCAYVITPAGDVS